MQVKVPGNVMGKRGLMINNEKKDLQILKLWKALNAQHTVATAIMDWVLSLSTGSTSLHSTSSIGRKVTFILQTLHHDKVNRRSRKD